MMTTAVLSKLFKKNPIRKSLFLGFLSFFAIGFFLAFVWDFSSQALAEPLGPFESPENMKGVPTKPASPRPSPPEPKPFPPAESPGEGFSQNPVAEAIKKLLEESDKAIGTLGELARSPLSPPSKEPEEEKIERGTLPPEKKVEKPVIIRTEKGTISIKPINEKETGKEGEVITREGQIITLSDAGIPSKDRFEKKIVWERSSKNPGVIKEILTYKTFPGQREDVFQVELEYKEISEKDDELGALNQELISLSVLEKNSDDKEPRISILKKNPAGDWRLDRIDITPENLKNLAGIFDQRDPSREKWEKKFAEEVNRIAGRQTRGLPTALWIGSSNGSPFKGWTFKDNKIRRKKGIKS